MVYSELETEKRNAIMSATDLCYKKDVIAALEKAETSDDIYNIMQKARTDGIKKDEKILATRVRIQKHKDRIREIQKHNTEALLGREKHDE